MMLPLFLQMLVAFAGKGEGKDGVGFVPSKSSSTDQAESLICCCIISEQHRTRTKLM